MNNLKYINVIYFLAKKCGREFRRNVCECMAAAKPFINGQRSVPDECKNAFKRSKNETKKETRKQPYTSNTFVLDLYVCPVFNENQAMQPLRHLAMYCHLIR